MLLDVNTLQLNQWQLDHPVRAKKFEVEFHDEAELAVDEDQHFHTY